MTEKEYSSEDTILVPFGHKAIVRFVKLNATCKEVCEKLANLNRHSARPGDLKDIQDLAKVALEAENEIQSTHDRLRETDRQGLTGDSQRSNRDQSRDSSIKS